MKKEVIIKDGGQMNQTIAVVEKTPPSIEFMGVKVSPDNIGIGVLNAVGLRLIALFIMRKLKNGNRD